MGPFTDSPEFNLEQSLHAVRMLGCFFEVEIGGGDDNNLK